MRYYSSKLLTSILILLTIGCSSQAEQMIENSQQKQEFIELLRTELANRAVAREITRQITEDKTLESHPFWLAYSELEQTSYPRLQKIAKKYNLSAEATWQTNSKVWFSKVAFQLFPKMMESKLHTAISEYIPKLEKLHNLAPGEHKSFLRWIVVQEQAQYTAFALAIEGKYQKAAQTLEEAKLSLKGNSE